MNCKKDLVSIISPCYNGEKYLPAFLDSVLSQTYPSIELIVVNDASEDKTQEILEKYVDEFKKRDYSLIVINQKENKGQAAAINAGLKLISGSFMTWMDSDDIFYPDAIEKKVKFLKENRNIDFVLNYGEVVSESDINTRLGLIQRIKPSKNDCLFKDLLDENNVVYVPGSIFVRTEALKTVLPDMEIYESREGQNWQLMLPLSYSCKYGYLNEVLFKYVIHSDSHSNKERTYEEQLARRDNFHILQVKTIESIINMSEIEKKYWCNYSYNRKIMGKYKISLRCFKFKEASVYYKELKNNKVNLKLHEKIMIYTMYSIVSTMIGKIKK